MDKFTCVEDIGDLRQAVAEALEIKRDRFQFTGLGRNKTLLMLFFMVAQYLEKVGYFPVDLIGCPYNPAPIVQRYTKGAGEKVDQVRKVGRKIVVEVF